MPCRLRSRVRIRRIHTVRQFLSQHREIPRLQGNLQLLVRVESLLHPFHGPLKQKCESNGSDKYRNGGIEIPDRLPRYGRDAEYSGEVRQRQEESRNDR